MKELQSIVDYEIPYPGPTVNPAFNTNCTPGCTVSVCSCTASHYYWSSTTDRNWPGSAWYVGFYFGHADTFSKYNLGMVRAVRGGS